MYYKEKFETMLPSTNVDGEDNEWTTAHSQRCVYAQPSVLNQLPPGEQGLPVSAGDFPASTGGSTDASNGQYVNQSSEEGYYRVEMHGWDDTETAEHADPFYVKVVVAGEEGFVERNNYLDRS